MLTRAIAEIDRVVKWNGYLVLDDFLPDFPTKRHYHHRTGEPIFTYKQDYAEIFRGRDKIVCLENIFCRNGWSTTTNLTNLQGLFEKIGAYLLSFINEHHQESIC